MRIEMLFPISSLFLRNFGENAEKLDFVVEKCKIFPLYFQCFATF